MNLDQFLRILRARVWLILLTLAVTVGTTSIVSLLLPPKYTATASIVIDFKALDPLSGTVLPSVLLPGYLATQLDIISSHNVALKAVDLLKLPDNPAAQQLFADQADGKGSIRDWLADLLLKDLKLEPSRESSLVNIKYRSNDPRFSAAVANAIVQGYINTNLELKIEPARLTAAWFDEQIKVLKRNMEVAQSALSAYQREKGILATEERLDVESARLVELSSQVVGAQAQTFDSAARQRQVNSTVAKGGSADALVDVLNNPVIQRLKAGLAEHEAKLADLSSRVGVNHPAYQSALAENEELKRKIDEEMKVVTRTVNATSSLAQNRESSLKGSLDEQRAKVLDMKKQRDQAAILLREVDSAQRAYDAAMARLTQTRLESHSNQTNIAVINPAIEPTEPSFPKIVLNFVISVFLGALIAVGLALLAEMMNRVVRTERDVVDRLGVAVLGRIEDDPGLHGSRLKRLFSRTSGLRSAGGS